MCNRINMFTYNCAEFSSTWENTVVFLVLGFITGISVVGLWTDNQVN